MNKKYFFLLCLALVGSHPTFASPARIVSIAPVVTEIICDLGAQSQLVGRSAACTYPKTIQKLPVVADSTKIYQEQLIQTHPTLVLGLDGFNTTAGPALDRLHLPYKMLKNPQTVGEISTLILQVGQSVNKKDAANQLVKQMNQRLGKPQPGSTKVLVLVNSQPFIAAGSDTLINDILIQAGCQNALAKTVLNYPKLSIEQILKANPDVIIVTEKSIGQNLRFIQNKRIIDTIPADYLTRPGPRVIDAILMIRKLTSS